MAVKTYKKGAATKLSANFRVSEFDCNGVGCCTTTKIDDKLVAYLQKIRDHFGKKVILASGYRCETHNAKVAKAASKSRHISGMAADIKVEGVAPAEVAKYAESIGVLGIGLYDSDADGHFVHIDTRDAKSFWLGHAQKRCTTFGGAAVKTVQVQLPQLQKGDRGETVKALQKLLGIKADGDFGAKTDTALRAAQKAANFPSDGICGAKTWHVLLGVSIV